VKSSAGPIRAIDPVELRLARSAAIFLVVLGLPVIAIAGLLEGAAGAASAAIGATVVIGMFMMAGATMSWAARISPAALMGAVLGGYLVRLFIYAALIILLRPVEWINGPALAISTAVLLVAVLIWEVRIVSRNPKLFWVDASAGQSTPRGVVETGNSAGAGAAPDATPTFVPPVERTRP
jgi:hypothetical protein